LEQILCLKIAAEMISHLMQDFLVLSSGGGEHEK
jgi:hypothetical protein